MTKEIKKPLVISNEKRARIDDLVISDSLADKLARANEGDVKAARAVLISIAHYLDPLNKEPLPLVMRGYLSSAFREMMAGVSADAALNLKVNGRPKNSYKLELRVAYLVFQGVREYALTVAESTILINKNLNHLGWHELNGNELQEELVKKWYYANLDKLKRIYEGG